MLWWTSSELTEKTPELRHVFKINTNIYEHLQHNIQHHQVFIVNFEPLLANWDVCFIWNIKITKYIVQFSINVSSVTRGTDVFLFSCKPRSSTHVVPSLGLKVT